jgi:putative ribosome biogenesis GTPase RsgA
MPKNKKPTDGTGSGQLVVTTQQSRFHVDVSDASMSKDIDIKGLNIVIGGREILSTAVLKLRQGTTYVLVGRNGMGKSSESSFNYIAPAGDRLTLSVYSTAESAGRGAHSGNAMESACIAPGPNQSS